MTVVLETVLPEWTIRDFNVENVSGCLVVSCVQICVEVVYWVSDFICQATLEWQNIVTSLKFSQIQSYRSGRDKSSGKIQPANGNYWFPHQWPFSMCLPETSTKTHALCRYLDYQLSISPISVSKCNAAEIILESNEEWKEIISNYSLLQGKEEGNWNIIDQSPAQFVMCNFIEKSCTVCMAGSTSAALLKLICFLFFNVYFPRPTQGRAAQCVSSISPPGLITECQRQQTCSSTSDTMFMNTAVKILLTLLF